MILGQFWSRFDLRQRRNRKFLGDDQGCLSEQTVVYVFGSIDVYDYDYVRIQLSGILLRRVLYYTRTAVSHVESGYQNIYSKRFTTRIASQTVPYINVIAHGPSPGATRLPSATVPNAAPSSRSFVHNSWFIGILPHSKKRLISDSTTSASLPLNTDEDDTFRVMVGQP